MKILVISPHPDDETLGAGGTIVRAKKEKNEIYWLNITGITEQNGFDVSLVEEKGKQINAVRDFFEFDDMRDLRLPTTKLDMIPCGEGIGYISDYMNYVKPQIVLIPHFDDAHSDHRCVFEWVHACTKVFRYPFVKYVLTMEILSETNFGLPTTPFSPNVYVDISEYLEKKKKAMQLYKNEMGKHPFPRSIESIEALAYIRGTEAGVKYAEGFQLVKAVI